MNALKAAGVTHRRIFTDKATGANTKRQGLQSLQVKVEEGRECFSKYFTFPKKRSFDETRLLSANIQALHLSLPLHPESPSKSDDRALSARAQNEAVALDFFRQAQVFWMMVVGAC